MSCSQLHLLSEILQKLCLATHREWVRSFAFLCVQFICHFVLLALNCAYLSDLQYWLGYICKGEASQRMQIHMLSTVFAQGRNNHAPFPQHAAVRIVNTRTRLQKVDMEQPFRVETKFSRSKKKTVGKYIKQLI